MLSVSVRVALASPAISSLHAVGRADGIATPVALTQPSRRIGRFPPGQEERPLSAVYDISETFVVRHAELNPIAATLEGVKGHDAEMTDFSPDAETERAEHARAGLRALAAATPENDADRVA